MARRGPPHQPRGSSAPASERYPPQYQVVESGVESYLSEFGAWPVSPLKLKMETAQIYQDVTGACLSELKDRGRIEYKEFDGNKYIVPPDATSPSPTDRVREATNRFYEFFSHPSNGYFGELGAYAAISKIYSELSISMDIHPKGNYPRKFSGRTTEFDAFMEFFQERFPIEVYNGFQFVDDEHRKLDVINGMASETDPVSNPVFINRLSSPFSKKESPNNGLIIDTRSILACEENNPDLSTAVNILDVDPHFEIIPKLETEDGLSLDGNAYDDKAGDPEDYKMIRPIKMATAATDLPDSYKRRVRGGVQFEYVSTLFRRMSEPVDQIATTVIQNIYHHLLRNPSGTPRGDVVQIGWESYRKNHTRVKTAVTRFEPDIKDRVRELLSRLMSDDIIIERNGDLYARKSLHPHVSFNF